MSSKVTSLLDGGDWDEARCIEALARLERLKQQLDDLRSTIPRLVEPLSAPPSRAIFGKFRDAINKSERDLKDFRNSWDSQETQALFDHAKKSAAGNLDRSAAAQLDRYGWIEKEKKNKAAAQGKKEHERKVEEDVVLTAEDRAKIIEQWQEKHSGARFEAKAENRDLSIEFFANSTRYRFHVNIHNDPNSKPVLDAKCEGTADVISAINRCIASRPKIHDLRYLLDMLAAYKTVKENTCGKCGKFLDKEVMRPIARRDRPSTDAHGQKEVLWEAVHETCLS